MVCASWTCLVPEVVCPRFVQSIKDRKDSLYALLVSTGYLKVASELAEGTCKVAIPNHEIAQVFVGDIQTKINRALSTGTGDIVGARARRKQRFCHPRADASSKSAV